MDLELELLLRKHARDDRPKARDDRDDHQSRFANKLSSQV